MLAIFPYSRRPQQSAADAFGLMIGSSTTFQSWQPASKTSTGKTTLAESKQAGWRVGNLAREFVSASGLTLLLNPANVAVEIAANFAANFHG